ncbi:YitT family protein [Streptomyces sp. NPDC020965]|uniref:membrane protein YczE n=1 Tax=Streptomyces sp. NPDC020965 TaxID=3365105 RepID=UPI0037B66FF2
MDQSTTTIGSTRVSTHVSRGSTRLTRRLLQLYVGLALYGVSAALIVRAGLGLEPWGVLHQGLSELTGLTMGVVTTVVGALVLLLWIPIRQRPGLGTVSNVLVIGVAMDATLALVPEVRGLLVQIPVLIAGIVLNGTATGLYIAARFGPGPRDGLMTGLHRVTGRSIRLVRTGLEAAVVATGFALGGSVGVGTVAYALAIGPLAQMFLRVFAVAEPGPAAAVAESGPGSPGRESGPTTAEPGFTAVTREGEGEEEGAGRGGGGPARESGGRVEGTAISR